MTDYKWKGTPEAIANLLYQGDGKTLKAGVQVIGPRILDGVAYVNIRTNDALTLPSGVSETGPELSDAVVGVWYDPLTAEQIAQMEAPTKATKSEQ
ncbi:hypothetical protein AD947_07390 [Acetobacter tropicalis]|uniref:Uncharacterized protein n=1 Tax=Acetobacter tropicalis TaxID=104102 RepID=A0A149TXQ7_9PROT|nr:hypothetical protein [Acetobacter tropicalis]KXV58004.1 hypothetical protein AD947_07390 [Acetobacter tropicalis]